MSHRSVIDIILVIVWSIQGSTLGISWQNEIFGMYLFGFHLNLRRQECLVKTQPDRCMFHSVCTFFLDEDSQMVVILWCVNKVWYLYLRSFFMLCKLISLYIKNVSRLHDCHSNLSDQKSTVLLEFTNSQLYYVHLKTLPTFFETIYRIG